MVQVMTISVWHVLCVKQYLVLLSYYCYADAVHKCIWALWWVCVLGSKRPFPRYFGALTFELSIRYPCCCSVHLVLLPRHTFLEAIRHMEFIYLYGYILRISDRLKCNRVGGGAGSFWAGSSIAPSLGKGELSAFTTELLRSKSHLRQNECVIIETDTCVKHNYQM